MPRTKLRRSLPKKTQNNDTLNLEELPEEQRKRYYSIIEDLDRQVNAHIADANTKMKADMEAIRNDYKIATYQLPKPQRQWNLEETVINWDKNQGILKSIRDSVSSKLDQVAEDVSSAVTKQVDKAKYLPKRGRPTSQKAKSSKQSAKRRSSSCPLPTSLRKSRRNRIPSDGSDKSVTPVTGFKVPLTSTARSSRTLGINTPCATPNLSRIQPITPKFAPMTPSLARLAKENELSVSLDGSPIYNPYTNKISQKKNFTPQVGNQIAVRLGDGTTLVLPEENDNAGQSVDLDIAARDKLIKIQNQIDRLLQTKGD